jgi:hypothetical protein
MSAGWGISVQDVALVLAGIAGASVSGFGGYKYGEIAGKTTCNAVCIQKNARTGTAAQKAEKTKSCNTTYPKPGGGMIYKAAMFGGVGIVLAVCIFIVVFVINAGSGMGMGGGYRSSFSSGYSGY